MTFALVFGTLLRPHAPQRLLIVTAGKTLSVPVAIAHPHVFLCPAGGEFPAFRLWSRPASFCAAHRSLSALQQALWLATHCHCAAKHGWLLCGRQVLVLHSTKCTGSLQLPVANASPSCGQLRTRDRPVLLPLWLCRFASHHAPRCALRGGGPLSFRPGILRHWHVLLRPLFAVADGGAHPDAACLGHFIRAFSRHFSSPPPAGVVPLTHH